MPLVVSNAFFRDIVGKSISEVHTMLVRYRHDDPHKVGKLIGKVEMLPGLGRLLAIAARYHSGYLSGLLGKYRHIGQR